MFIDRKVNGTHWQAEVVYENEHTLRSTNDYRVKFRRIDTNQCEHGEHEFQETFIAENKHELGDKVCLYLIEEEVKTIIDKVMHEYLEDFEFWHLNSIKLLEIYNRVNDDLDAPLHASTFLEHVEGALESSFRHINMTGRDKRKFRMNYHNSEDNKFNDAFRLLSIGE